MIPLKTIRENPDYVREGASKKGENLNIDSILEKDKVIRDMIGKVETLKGKRNTVTNEISELKIASSILSLRNLLSWPLVELSFFTFEIEKVIKKNRVVKSETPNT